MKNIFYLLDTFTDEYFKGNPTPVCLLEYSLPNETMFSLANEFNSPVTVFIEPKRNNIYPIRYFTKTGEIPACGHGTLGASTVLLEKMKEQEVNFETIEKIKLTAKIENGQTFIEYPKFEPIAFNVTQQLIDTIGLKSFSGSFYCLELQSLFIEVDSESTINELKPNFLTLKESSNEIKEVVIMSQSSDLKYDFVLRSFCPWIGINEDPVTGSIHSVLGHYWQNRLKKNQLNVYQASDRGGKIFVHPQENSVLIGGHCKIIIEGKLKI